MDKLIITVEKSSEGYSGWTEYKPSNGHGFFHSTVGNSIPEIVTNLKESIKDSIDHELADDPAWNGVNIDNLSYELTFNLESFFETYNEIKITAIAERSGINGSLLRQYATGIKNASTSQVEKIQKAIRQLGAELQTVQLA